MLLSLLKLLTSNKLFLWTKGDYQLITRVQQRLPKCVLNLFEAFKIFLKPEEIPFCSYCSQSVHTLNIYIGTW